MNLAGRLERLEGMVSPPVTPPPALELTRRDDPGLLRGEALGLTTWDEERGRWTAGRDPELRRWFQQALRGASERRSAEQLRQRAAREE